MLKKLTRPTRFWNRLAYDWRHNKALLSMQIVPALSILLFSVIPMVGIYYAFTRFDFGAGLFGSPFVGLENFRFLFISGTAWIITRNTIIYNLIFIFGGNVLRITVAILLAEVSSHRFRRVTQTIIFLPNFISMVLVGVFAYSLFGYETGFFNGILQQLGFERFDFYGTDSIWWLLIPVIEAWKSTGYGSIIYLAAILGISSELYEAASLDGASFLQRVRYITLPSLKPTFIILLLLSLGNIMRGQFALFYQLIGNNGRLFNTTDIIDTYVFRSLQSGGSNGIGMGTAAGLYQSLVGLFVVLGANALIRHYDRDSALF